MTIGLGDIARTTVNFGLGDGTQYQNVWHHKRIGATGFSNTEVTAALQSHFQTAYSTLTLRSPASIVPRLCYVDKVDWSGTEWEVVENIGTFTLTFVGTETADEYANQISPYIIYKTVRPKTVGRKFMFPFTEAFYDGSIIDGTLVASLVSFAANSLVDVYLGVIDDLEVGVPRTAEATFYEFVVAVVTNVCGTQRRRRPGVGA